MKELLSEGGAAEARMLIMRDAERPRLTSREEDRADVMALERVATISTSAVVSSSDLE